LMSQYRPTLMPRCLPGGQRLLSVTPGSFDILLPQPE
jgi:hypothetical protein